MNLRLPVLHTTMPKTRAGCADVPRPCPHVGCRYNLYLEVKERQTSQYENGRKVVEQFVSLNHPEREPWDMPAARSCALDVAEGEPLTHREIGEVFGLSHGRAQQIEQIALDKVERRINRGHEIADLRDLFEERKAAGC